MSHKIFVNLPVKDLEKTKEFWTKLGYNFNPQFTNDKAGSLIIDEQNGIYAMLITEEFFKTFIPNQEIADSAKTKEVLTALSVDSKEEVETLVEKALAAGAKEEKREQYDFMHVRAFTDLDGHTWEIFWMDPSYIQK